MRMSIYALICMHILLWTGCQSAPGLHRLRSNENLLRRAIDSTQISRSSWRKLLEVNGTAHSNGIQEGTLDANAIREPKGADAKNATTHAAGKADVWDVKKHTASVDEKKEEVKPDPALSITQKEEGKSGGAAMHNVVNKVEEPKTDANQESSTGVEKKETHQVEKEKKMEVLRVEPNVPSQAVQIEERSSDNENVTKEGVESAQETSMQSLNESFTDAQGSNPDPGEKDTLAILPKSVKEENLPVALTENDKHDSTHEHADESPADEIKTSGESRQQDNPAKGSTNIGENTDSIKERLADVNPITMVTTTSSDVKDIDAGDADKVVLTTQPEGVGKEQNAFASKQNPDNHKDSIDGPSESTLNTTHGKLEDEKIEDKNESNASLEIKEEKNEDGTEAVSQEQSDGKVDEKQEVSDNDGDKHNESNDIEANEKNTDENQDSSDGSTVTKDEEMEENDSKDISVVAKSDDETEAATKEVEMQLEALKRDTMIETTAEQANERDPSEDEYDIIQELADLPTKFQETAGKVANHLRPDVIKWTDTSKVYFNLANQQITKSFSPLLGKQYAPFFASMISYGILLLPLIVVILLFDHIKAIFSLQKVLLFINIYLAAYFATLWLASFIIGLEPMSFFYLNSLSSYLSLQLLQGLAYFVYLILQTANIFHSCTSDTLVGKVTSALQWTVAMAIGLHYYVTVFHPAVASKPPHTSWKFYAIYTVAFFVLCFFARIRWVKKQYVTSGSNIADKKS